VTETRTPAPSAGRPAESRSGNRLLRFYRQVVAELRKVVWPTRKQLSTYFVVVLTFVVFVIVIVSVLDLAFGWAMFKIFG
jgi:preprotein translocase subunit SecE